jgi:hypothetical protein
MSFATPLYLCGPLREPKQMLADQQYSGHTSIHDDSMAEKLGFRAGPIEGPTHFSLFVPLLAEIWGQAWFERGCFSSHFQNMVVEGELVRAFVERPGPGATRVRAWAEKADGTPVLEASASLGPDDGATLLDERMAKLRAPEKLVILSDLHVGMLGAADEKVRMDAEQHMGDLYPFSLAQKLEGITENSPWYSDAASTPWGRAVIPLEMVSVLAEYTSKQAAFPVKRPSVCRRELPDPSRDRCPVRKQTHRILLGPQPHLRRQRRNAQGRNAAKPCYVEAFVCQLRGRSLSLIGVVDQLISAPSGAPITGSDVLVCRHDK